MRHLPPLRISLTSALSCVLAFSGGRARAQTGEEGDRAKITAIRYWSLGDVTRIAVESTGEFRFRPDRLHNPERVFFDFFGAKPQLQGQGSKGSSTIPVGDQFVRQIRVAETQRGITRVVFDVQPNVEFSTSELSNPDRLIIELHPAGMPAALLNREIGEPIPPITVDAPIARPAPRMAHLDFSEALIRREMALRRMVPVLLDPPSPFDPGMRFATRLFNKPDPLADLGFTRPRLLPPPPRVARVMPGTLARMTPPPPPEPIPLTVPPVPASAVEREEVGLPAKHTPGGDTMTRILGLKLGRVVIDPGHGGHDNGTSGSDGLREKDIALDVSRRLGLLLQERLGSEVIYTRADDTFVPLSRRTAIANQRKADLFLSIHVNSSPVRSVAGMETYYLSFTTSRPALETAMRENAGADNNIGDLQDLLKKIALKDKVDESREFATRIQTSLLSLSPKNSRPVKDRGIKRAPFVVLIGALMPSVLAEVGFISNPQDETLMKKPEYRQRIAEALYKGVAAYANSLSHFDLAQQSSSRLTKPADAAPR